jgi:hypothetical protein
MAQHIRPALRTHRGCHSEPRRLHPEDLARLLKPNTPSVRRVKEWTPSVEYELVARHMHPDVREAYVAKSKAWFDAHPPPPPRQPPAPSTVDLEALAALIAKYGSEAPLSEYRKAGCTEMAIERIRAKRQWYEDHSDELQAEIDRRWPGSATPKPKKVIKAVKKKMP